MENENRDVQTRELHLDVEEALRLIRLQFTQEKAQAAADRAEQDFFTELAKVAIDKAGPGIVVTGVNWETGTITIKDEPDN